MTMQGISYIRWDPTNHKVVWPNDFSESRKNAYRAWAKKSYNDEVLLFLEALEAAYQTKNNSLIQDVYSTYLKSGADKEVIANNKEQILQNWNSLATNSKFDAANKIATDVATKDLQSQMNDFKNTEKQNKKTANTRKEKVQAAGKTIRRNVKAAGKAIRRNVEESITKARKNVPPSVKAAGKAIREKVGKKNNVSLADIDYFNDDITKEAGIKRKNEWTQTAKNYLSEKDEFQIGIELFTEKYRSEIKSDKIEAGKISASFTDIARNPQQIVPTILKNAFARLQDEKFVLQLDKLIKNYASPEEIQKFIADNISPTVYEGMKALYEAHLENYRKILPENEAKARAKKEIYNFINFQLVNGLYIDYLNNQLKNGKIDVKKQGSQLRSFKNATLYNENAEFPLLHQLAKAKATLPESISSSVYNNLQSFILSISSKDLLVRFLLIDLLPARRREIQS